MNTTETNIDDTLRVLESVEPQIAEVAARVCEAVGTDPRSPLEVAMLRGLRLVPREDDSDARLDGSSIVFGLRSFLVQDKILREVARWELREITHDETCVELLRDRLQGAFGERTLDQRRQDVRMLMNVFRSTLDSIKRRMAERVEHADRLAGLLLDWSNGGPVPQEARQLEKLAVTDYEQSSDLCSGFRFEEAVLTGMAWAMGRDQHVDLDNALESLFRSVGDLCVGRQVMDEMDEAVEAAHAAESAGDSAAA
jgi:hypothetical protein